MQTYLSWALDSIEYIKAIVFNLSSKELVLIGIWFNLVLIYGMYRTLLLHIKKMQLIVSKLISQGTIDSMTCPTNTGLQCSHPKGGSGLKIKNKHKTNIILNIEDCWGCDYLHQDSKIQYSCFHPKWSFDLDIGIGEYGHQEDKIYFSIPCRCPDK